jgi:hypothetical protein
MSYPPQGNGSVDTSSLATLANQTTLLTRLSAVRAGYLDHLNRDRPDMVFWSAPNDANSPIIVLPAVAADLDFPSVVVSGLPSGITIAKADFVLLGTLFDTSGSENQVDQASKSIRVKLSTGSWGTDDIQALVFGNLSLQTKADATRALILNGAIDIKSVVTADGTYNFRSEETNRSEGVTVTGASLEILDAFSIIRVWFN